MTNQSTFFTSMTIFPSIHALSKARITSLIVKPCAFAFSMPAAQSSLKNRMVLRVIVLSCFGLPIVIFQSLSVLTKTILSLILNNVKGISIIAVLHWYYSVNKASFVSLISLTVVSNTTNEAYFIPTKKPLVALESVSGFLAKERF